MFSFVSLGLVCVTFFLSCETNHQAEEQQLDTALAIPEKIISNVDAAVLYQNDHNTRLSTIGKEKTSFEDKAIHYNVATLTTYINRLEAISVSKNIPITGVSFVFGADTYGKRTTFLMPSTRNATLDYQESFTVENGQFLTFKHIQKVMKPRNTSVNDENLVLSPNGYLSFNEATVLFNNYQSQYIQPFAAKVTRDYYTKAVWYSLEEIKGYINYLQNKSDQYKLAITSIDVFFGVYNKDVSLALKSNAQTVFLVARTQKQAIVNTNGKSLKTLTQEEFYAKEDITDEDESLAYNLGHLSPPPPKNNQ